MIGKLIAYWLIGGVLVFIWFAYVIINSKRKTENKIGKLTDEEENEIIEQTTSITIGESTEVAKGCMDRGNELLSNITNSNSIRIVICVAVLIIAWPYTLKYSATLINGFKEFTDYKSQNKESK